MLIAGGNLVLLEYLSFNRMSKGKKIVDTGDLGSIYSLNKDILIGILIKLGLPVLSIADTGLNDYYRIDDGWRTMKSNVTFFIK
ncbi:MAG: hypothetical protein ACTSVU_03315 [Promethearchaeota archaeon]